MMTSPLPGQWAEGLALARGEAPHELTHSFRPAGPNRSLRRCAMRSGHLLFSTSVIALAVSGHCCCSLSLSFTALQPLLSRSCEIFVRHSRASRW